MAQHPWREEATASCLTESESKLSYSKESAADRGAVALWCRREGSGGQTGKESTVEVSVC